MILVIPDAGLESVLRSSVVIEQLWPGAAHEVMVLITLLRGTAMPMLADVLILGLVGLMTPVVGSPPGQVVLSYRRVLLTAIAMGARAGRVDAPYDRPHEVVRLDVVDVAVGGQSALRAAV
jgi:hypothetical protein